MISTERWGYVGSHADTWKAMQLFSAGTSSCGSLMPLGKCSLQSIGSRNCIGSKYLLFSVASHWVGLSLAWERLDFKQHWPNRFAEIHDFLISEEKDG